MKDKIAEIFFEIETEYFRAMKKHPNFSDNILEQVAIMQKEAGEVTKALLQFHQKETNNLDEVKSELIQTAAMCIRMLNALKDK